jgi:hypothetical protein
VVRLPGVVSVVVTGGNVAPGHPIEVEFPPAPLRRLDVV